MRLKNVLIVVKDIERSRQFYHDLFGLELILDNDGNMILSEGLVLQDEKIWSELFLSDRDGLLAVLRRFISRLEEFGSALERRDKAAIESIIRDGAARCHKSQS